MKKIVLIGGGHTHLETIQRLGERSFAQDYKLILITINYYYLLLITVNYYYFLLIIIKSY